MDDNKKYTGWEITTWWILLIVAVMAIPTLGVAISLASGTKGVFSVAIFIVTCWISTFLGMKLMQRVDKK